MEKFKTLFDFTKKNNCIIKLNSPSALIPNAKCRASLTCIPAMISIQINDNSNIYLDKIIASGRTSEEALDSLDKFLCIVSNAIENPETDR